MGRAEQAIAVRRLDTLLRAGTAGGLTDAELIERFARRRDEAAELAFGALVMRHGAMVLRVCRGVLRDSHAADDAFQATFLVLARRAGSLWVRDSLGPWLHQTAYRTASRARCAAARRRRHEGRAAELTALSTDGGLDDVGDVVHEEVDRLPERYRVAVVLCLLEGRTPEQAARHLGCPVGTVHSRLARGRARLRSRLTDRGVAVPAVLLAGSIPRTASAALSPALIEAAVRAAMGSTAGRWAAAGFASSITDVIARQARRIVLMNQIKLAAAVVLSVGLVTACGGVLARIGAMTGGPSQETPSKESEADAPPPKAEDAQAAATQPIARPNPAPTRSASVSSDAVHTVAYSPDGRTIAASGGDGAIRLWDGATGEKRATLEGPVVFARGLAFSSAGETIAGACNDKSVSLWDAKTGEVKNTFPFFSHSMQAIASQRASVDAVVFSPDGKRIAAGGSDGAIAEGKAFYQIRVFEADSGRLLWEHIGRGTRVLSLAFSPAGETLAHADSMTVRLWDAGTGDLKQVLKPERGGVHAVSFSSDSKLLAGGGVSRREEADDVGPLGQVTIWEAATGVRLRTLIGPTGLARAVAFAPDGYAVAGGGYGRYLGRREERRMISEVRLWDAASGELKWTWEGRGTDVTSLAFSPDGKSLAVCNADEFGLVDVASGKTARILMKTTRR